MTCTVTEIFSGSICGSCLKHWRESKPYWIVNFTGYLPYLFVLMKLTCFQQKE